MNGHVLYTKNDFKHLEWDKWDKTAEMVVEGGLNVCKICGEFEAGLDEQCVIKSRKEIHK
ncbi:hypothetical protein [Bacillus atrophaeus]|uniref:hypothetical protein n=1 Tax=Bacillus atrophaeus TaxID=1452 RepID=UPI00227E8B5C|nr:hypothetical protein [Bacillus atrophaeus]MCY7948007.1 hypothetical protein [Bacillus atrophaeus]MCY8098048.1 hypothetical protein [Bacillus atrophaeus]MCY9169972.1 hypothetical protein [Bacillus atrophaeus]MEC0740697.1 hypothetical protein [Bacillus atrophaeus]MEC0747039.1 hypothetical protein [Bacillus atrophaeus]